MPTIRVPIVVRAATGRMTRRQHLERSLAAIIADGGVRLDDGSVVLPEPLLLGRSEETLVPLARQLGFRHSTDLEAVLRDPPEGAIFFDGGPTSVHYEGLSRAIAAGMHVYTEKPLTLEVEESLALARQALARGVCGGVVQDKRYLPGPMALAEVIRSGRIGQVYHVLMDFGYFVHPDDGTRPDWNADKAQGGGIIMDMVSHWDYLLKMLVGQPRRVSAHAAMHIRQRRRQGRPVPTTAEDAVYATFEVDGPAAGEPIICTTVSAWCRRPRKRGLLEIRVQGTLGAAEAYLDRCYWISNERTPAVSWDPDTASREDFLEGWEGYTGAAVPANAFRHQWEGFLRHVVAGAPNPAPLLDGAQGVETACCTALSARSGNRPVEIRDLGALFA
ncbi:MAG: Gfo/Idh/MocA family oxidoreductase [Candidatus Latescibacterota bacterium]